MVRGDLGIPDHSVPRALGALHDKSIVVPLVPSRPWSRLGRGGVVEILPGEVGDRSRPGALVKSGGVSLPPCQHLVRLFHHPPYSCLLPSQPRTAAERSWSANEQSNETGPRQIQEAPESIEKSAARSYVESARQQTIKRPASPVQCSQQQVAGVAHELARPLPS